MIEIRRVLKPTGSVYLHCDNEANAYLRQMMDAVFGSGRFKNEIIWNRVNGRGDGKRFGRIHDTILFYSKSAKPVWNNVYVADAEYVSKYFKGKDARGSYQSIILTGPGTSLGESGSEWRGYDPTTVGRTWSVPRTGKYAEWIENSIIPNYREIDSIHARLDALESAGFILWSKNGVPRLKQYADYHPGKKVNDLFLDIRQVRGNEETGYPTQKPQVLAKRLIEASSNPGDIVLDCFAGCAYVPVAAEITGRRWIACDMSPRAWTVVRRQFHKHSALGIVTEGELFDTVEPRIENVERVIRVRGPGQLPKRTSEDAVQATIIKTLPRPRFKQRAVEDGATIWQAFVDEWGTACWYCDTEKAADRRELQLDHIEPNKGDGTNDDCFNRALACSPCNSDKSNELNVKETIAKALEEGRIQTTARHDEVLHGFKIRHEWAKLRWTRIKPNMLPI